jgi:hypothetical protein
MVIPSLRFYGTESTQENPSGSENSRALTDGAKAWAVQLELTP